MNLAGEFLVMAATLLEIKSRMLIPRQAGESGRPQRPGHRVEDLADPRYELVKQLLAYKEFKDAATDLRRRAQTESARFRGRCPARGPAPLDIEDLDFFRLIDAFNAIMASVGHSAFGHEVVYDDTPISLHQADILDRLTAGCERGGRWPMAGRKGLDAAGTCSSGGHEIEMIGLFLATLELIRQKKIIVDQAEPLGEIRLLLRESTDIEGTVEGGEGLAEADAEDEAFPGGGDGGSGYGVGGGRGGIGNRGGFGVGGGRGG